MFIPRPPPSHTRRKDLKRFSVRDGFHLKERNDERRVEIDHSIGAETGIYETTNQATNEACENGLQQGPTSTDAVLHRASSVDTEVAMIFDLLQRPAPHLSNDVIPQGASEQAITPTANPERTVPLGSAYRQAEAAAIFSRLGPSADWLVYRQRTNLTPRRRDEQLEQMISEVLDAQASNVLRPTVPPPSTTEKRRNRCKHTRSHGKYYHDSDYGKVASIFLAPVLSSPSVTQGRATKPQVDDSKLSYTTHRSRLRQKSAVPIKTEKLLGRLDELRSFPAVVERVLQLERDKRQEFVSQHGENLVVKNKKLHRLIPPLQRPVHTPVFPSIVEHRQQQAIRRKQMVEENQETMLKSVVNRWQNRRQEILQQERLHHTQSQWLLITVLGQATARWVRQFRECRAHRDMIFRLAMIKRIQRYWKQRRILRQNAQAALLMPSGSPLRSQFFRMPTVMRAILVVQVGMRRWLARRRVRERIHAVEVIITSWLEFQDVKFRRLILRFRKRVRDFQTMWRTWRTITDARVKLLLMVWARVEKKHRRRGGLTPNTEAEAYSNGDTNTRGLSSGEKIHRHLRNGGLVTTAVSELGLSQSFGKGSPRHSPSKRSNHEVELRRQAEEDLQFAMREFYTNNRNQASKTSVSQNTTSLSQTSIHGTSHRNLSSTNTAKNPSSSSIHPWRQQLSPSHNEKIPLSLKVSLLRHLLSEKRNKFRITKERKRAEWKERRQQQRRVDFRYNVLEELAAYQRFEAEHAVFMVLRSISEHEILHLIAQAHQRLHVSTNPHTPFDVPLLELPPNISLP